MAEGNVLISLRARLSIYSDLHPDLYEVFKNTPASRHNAMVMQMLLRLATIEKHGGLTSSNQVSAPAQKSSVVAAPAPQAKAAAPIASTVPLAVVSSHGNETKRGDAPNMSHLAGALGGFVVDLD